MTNIPESIEKWIWSLFILAGGLIAGFIVYRLLVRIFERMSSFTQSPFYGSFIIHCRKASMFILLLLGIYISLPLAYLPEKTEFFIARVLTLLLIPLVAWFFIRLMNVTEDGILARFKIEEKDNLQARRVYTQLNIIKKIVSVIVIIFAVSAVLMSFESFRRLGTSILASVGLAGIIIGLAAQQSISNLLAGIQIAFTQPVRIDDVVIVENEWGRIEEITLTYVVVRIWDLRRLVLPIRYFIDKPFQNWTRVSADLLGSVYLYLDYSVPVGEVREEFHRILKTSEMWDGNVWSLQVTGASERTMELRGIMSAPDSSSAWNLRCETREKLIDFIRTKYPAALPVTRAVFRKTEEF